jgi:hypothetical protein
VGLATSPAQVVQAQSIDATIRVADALVSRGIHYARHKFSRTDGAGAGEPKAKEGPTIIMCSVCKNDKAPAEFSKKQQVAKHRAKCKLCVEGAEGGGGGDDDAGTGGKTGRGGAEKKKKKKK